MHQKVRIGGAAPASDDGRIVTQGLRQVNVTGAVEGLAVPGGRATELRSANPDEGVRVYVGIVH
jgi:hypothetical protein